MKEQPTLTTERLIIRPYCLSDAKEVQRLIGDRDVVDTLLNVPYPYEDGMAED
jgi:[ribosomal protein S5]-alanine N-acetyltransferase